MRGFQRLEMQPRLMLSERVSCNLDPLSLKGAIEKVKSTEKTRDHNKHQYLSVQVMHPSYSIKMTARQRKLDSFPRHTLWNQRLPS